MFQEHFWSANTFQEHFWSAWGAAVVSGIGFWKRNLWMLMDCEEY